MFGTIAPIVGQIFYPSAVLVMGLQHRLRGVDVTVSTVLTTSILAVLAATGYLLIVTAMETVGPPTPLAVFATAALVAIGLLPMRRLIRRRVDRLVYGDAGAPEAARGHAGGGGGRDRHRRGRPARPGDGAAGHAAPRFGAPPGRGGRRGR